MKDERKQELLKDRRDYREALIYKKEQTEAKIKAVEDKIAEIKKY